MGSKMSTVETRQAHIANANARATPSVVPSASMSCSNKRSTMHESRATAVSAENQCDMIEIIREPAPAGAFQVNMANTNRVISFHSPACWREYFHASKQSDKLIVIYFTASWCPPCRYIGPILDEFAAQYTDVEFDKIDVDELCNVASEFGVQAMPTFLFIKRGKEIDKVIGAKNEELQTKIEKHRV